jgi:hypothetical protein
LANSQEGIHAVSGPTEFRDPLYGFISLDELECRLVDSPPFQRLRRILELGPTYLVFPSGCHSRFEHSLGTLEVATRLFDHVAGKSEGELAERVPLDENRRVLRIAALLHDLGHAPFSHAAETLLPAGMTHESYTRRLILGGDVGKILDDGGVDKERVARIACGARGGEHVDQLLAELVTGEIGADRMDYLRRDSYHLGVAYGVFDTERLLRTIRIARDPAAGNRPRVVVESDGVFAAEGLIMARVFMFLNVYFHKTRRSLDMHLTDFIAQECLTQPQRVYPADLEGYLALDDHAVQRKLGTSTSELARRVVGREHFREAFVWMAPETEDNTEETVVRLVCDRLQRQFGRDGIKYDVAGKAPYLHQESGVQVWSGRADMSGRQLRRLAEVSLLVKSLKTVKMVRIYAKMGIRDRVERRCQEILQPQQTRGVANG